jgi:hypothetical protein
LFFVRKEVGLDVNDKKIKYKSVSVKRNSGKRHKKECNQVKALWNYTSKSKLYLEEMTMRLLSENASYSPVTHAMHFLLFSKVTKIKTYITVIIPDVYMELKLAF